MVKLPTLVVFGAVDRVPLLWLHFDGAARHKLAHAGKHRRLQRARLCDVCRTQLKHAAGRRGQAPLCVVCVCDLRASAFAGAAANDALPEG